MAIKKYDNNSFIVSKLVWDSIICTIDTREIQQQLQTVTPCQLLPPKVVLHAYNIILIGRIFGISMLPNFSQNSPVIEAHQPVAFALLELHGFTSLVPLQ